MVLRKVLITGLSETAGDQTGARMDTFVYLENLSQAAAQILAPVDMSAKVDLEMTCCTSVVCVACSSKHLSHSELINCKILNKRKLVLGFKLCHQKGYSFITSVELSCKF